MDDEGRAVEARPMKTSLDSDLLFSRLSFPDLPHTIGSPGATLSSARNKLTQQ